MPFRAPSGFVCGPASCPSFDFCKPKAASLVANVLAKGLYGAVPGVVAGLSAALGAWTAPGGGSDPEFLLVLRMACSMSESAVAVVSESSSEESVFSGGGGETRPADSLRGTSSGDCGGVWILTLFSFLPILKGAVCQYRQCISPILPGRKGHTRRPLHPRLLRLQLHVAWRVAPEWITRHC